MKQIAILIMAAAFLTGCKTSKQAQPQLPIMPIENNTNTRIIHTETIDTVFIEIPVQSAEKTTPEGFSHLETDVAESDAKINPDGTLSHSIKNKPTPLPAPVKNTADTIVQEVYVEKPVPVEVPKIVERELTRWEKTRLNTWGWLLATFALMTGWTFRKPLIGLARRLLTKKP